MAKEDFACGQDEKYGSRTYSRVNTVECTRTLSRTESRT